MSDRATSGTPAREEVIGLVLALYLLTGRWSIARIFGMDNSILLQPRAWVVVGLVILAMLPPRPPPQRTPYASTGLFILAAQLLHFGFLLLSIGWSPDLTAASEKGFDVGILGVVSISTWWTCATVDRRALYGAIVRWVVVVAGVLALLATVSGINSDRSAVLGGGPNIFGRNMGMLCVLSLAYAIDRRMRWAVVAIVAAMLTVSSGSRGAMIALAAALVGLVFAKRTRVSRWLAAGTVGTALGLLVLPLTAIGQRAIAMFEHRVLDLLIERQYYSSRDVFFREALELIERSPVVGHGLASFPTYTSMRYPHSVLLESGVEAGAVGVVLVLVPILIWAWTVVATRRFDLDEFVAPFVLIFVAAQFSGDIYDSRGIFLFVLLSATLGNPGSPFVRRGHRAIE